MIPLLETSRTAGAVAQVPPPSFRPLGRVTHASLDSRGYKRAQGLTDAQKAGLRYESHVQADLLERFRSYDAGPTIRCLDNGVCRTLKPDGIIVRPKDVFIFEIKYTHVPEAWWQLEKLYKVALDELYHRPISLVEICRSYDPATPFPCEVELVSNLEQWVSCPRPTFGVHVWRKPTS